MGYIESPQFERLQRNANAWFNVKTHLQTIQMSTFLKNNPFNETFFAGGSGICWNYNHDETHILKKNYSKAIITSNTYLTMYLYHVLVFHLNSERRERREATIVSEVLR